MSKKPKLKVGLKIFIVEEDRWFEAEDDHQEAYLNTNEELKLEGYVRTDKMAEILEVISAFKGWKREMKL